MAEICHTKVAQVTLRDVSNGMLGNKRSSFSNRLIPILPKSENDVRIWAKLERTNPTGLPVGSVRIVICLYIVITVMKILILEHFL